MSEKKLSTLLIISVIVNLLAIGTITFHWIKIYNLKRKFPPPSVKYREFNHIMQDRQELMELLCREDLDSVVLNEKIDSIFQRRADIASKKTHHAIGRLRSLPENKREKIIEKMRDCSDHYKKDDRIKGHSKKSDRNIQKEGETE